MGVGDTLYESLWYNRSKRYRGLLPMVLLRAQNPVCMKAGPLWKISVEFSMQVWINYECIRRCLRNTEPAFSVKPVGAKCYVQNNVTMNNRTAFNTTSIRFVGHAILCVYKELLISVIRYTEE
jgi:hypothetical protein